MEHSSMIQEMAPTELTLVTGVVLGIPQIVLGIPTTPLMELMVPEMELTQEIGLSIPMAPEMEQTTLVSQMEHLMALEIGHQR